MGATAFWFFVISFHSGAHRQEAGKPVEIQTPARIVD